MSIFTAAHLWIQRHGDHATAKAREKVEEMGGDDDGADVWLRLIVAIGTLSTPSTDARH